jgi:hypothetical protein
VVQAWLRQTLFRYLLWTLSHCSISPTFADSFTRSLICCRSLSSSCGVEIRTFLASSFCMVALAWLYDLGSSSIAIAPPNCYTDQVICSGTSLQDIFCGVVSCINSRSEEEKRGIVGQIHMWMRWGRLLITGPFTELVSS